MTHIRYAMLVLVAEAVFAASVFSFTFVRAESAPNYLQQSAAANEMCANWWKAEQEKKAKDPKYDLKETGPACSVNTCNTPVGKGWGRQVAAAAAAQCEVGGHCLRDGCKAEGQPGLPEEIKPQELPPNATAQPLDPNTKPTSIGTPNAAPNTNPNTTPSPIPTSGTTQPNTTPNGSVTPNTGTNATPSPLPSSGSSGGIGSTFPQLPSHSLTPGSLPSSGGGGLSGGVYSGGNPFSNGSTFSGGNWNNSSSGGSGGSFGSFFSGISNLIAGLFGRSPSSGIARSPSPAPSVPQQQPVSRPSMPTQVAGGQFSDIDPSLMTPADFEKLFGPTVSPLDAPLPVNPMNGFPIVPSQSIDRPGLPLTSPLESLTGGSAPVPLPGTANPFNEDAEPTPSAPTDGGRGLAQNGGGTNDASPPLPAHPDWWPKDVERKFAQTLEAGNSGSEAVRETRYAYAKDVSDGLMKGSVIADAEAVKTARALLQEEITNAEAARDRFAISATGFQEMVDRAEWLPDFLKSSEQQALNQARSALNSLAYAQGIAQLRLDAHTIVPTSEAISAQAQARLQELTKSYNALSQRIADARKEAGWRGTFERLLPDSMESQDVADTKSMEESLSGMQKRLNDFAKENGAQLTYSMTLGEPWKVSADANIGTAVSPSPVYALDPAPISSAEFSSFPAETISSTAEVETALDLTPTPAPQPTPVPTNPTPTPTPQTPPASPPKTPPSTPPAPSPSAPASSGGAGSSSGGGLIQGGLSLLNSLLQSIKSFFGGSDNGNTTQSQSPQPTPAGSITANPSQIQSGAQSKLSWSSVGTQGCAIINDSFEVLVRGGMKGDLISPSLTASTRFGLVCDIADGKDKFVNETLVRVKGDSSEPSKIFPYSGSVSQAVAEGRVDTSATAGVSAGTGSSSAPPNDVRTCDPEQSIDSFIHCLCQAEPNSNGCAIPPRGI